MQVLEAYKPFEIQELELLTWKQRPIINNFFELVLIQEGEGTQCINYNETFYTKGSVFLLPPLKCHQFKIKSATKFIFLKFTASFFKNFQKDSIDRNKWFNEASYILSNYNQLPGDIINSEIDKEHINKLVFMILQESTNLKNESLTLIKSLMTSILEVLMRNVKKSHFYEVNQNISDKRITKMLIYINEYIDKPDRLKVPHLAKVFLMSPTYVSEYFKKQVNMPLREYIIKAKLKLVEIRLLNSNYTLTQIANDLGFTDVSHLSKTFKRYVGISIKEFKNNGEYKLLKRDKSPSN